MTDTFDISYLPSRVIHLTTSPFVPPNISKNEHFLSAHEAFLSWSEENGLSLNLDKCKALSVLKTDNFAAVRLAHVSSVNELQLLGVIFDGKNNWLRHVSNITRAASRNMFIVKCLRNAFDQSTLIDVYACTML